MELEPIQKPHPPIWYGIHSVDSAERAARRGLHVVSLDPPVETRAFVDRYRQNLARNPRKKVLPYPRLASADSSWSPTPTKRPFALRAVPTPNGIEAFIIYSNSHCRRAGSPDDQPNWMPEFRSAKASPAFSTVTALLEAQVAQTKANYLVGQFAFGDLSRLFGLFTIPKDHLPPT